MCPVACKGEDYLVGTQVVVSVEKFAVVRLEAVSVLYDFLAGCDAFVIVWRAGPGLSVEVEPCQQGVCRTSVRVSVVGLVQKRRYLFKLR